MYQFHWKPRFSPLQRVAGRTAYVIFLFALAVVISSQPDQSLAVKGFAWLLAGDMFIKFVNFVLGDDSNEEVLARLDRIEKLIKHSNNNAQQNQNPTS